MSTRYYRILYFALAEKKKESRKSLIFRILPRCAFALGGPIGICFISFISLKLNIL